MDVSLAQRSPWSPGRHVPRKVAILPGEVAIAARNYQNGLSAPLDGTRSRCPTHTARPPSHAGGQRRAHRPYEVFAARKGAVARPSYCRPPSTHHRRERRQPRTAIAIFGVAQTCGVCAGPGVCVGSCTTLENQRLRSPVYKQRLAPCTTSYHVVLVVSIEGIHPHVVGVHVAACLRRHPCRRPRRRPRRHALSSPSPSPSCSPSPSHQSPRCRFRALSNRRQQPPRSRQHDMPTCRCGRARTCRR